MTQGGKNDNHGDRTPLIYAYATPRFHIASSVGSDISHHYDHHFEFHINQTYSFVVQQRYVSAGNYRYTILIDGEEIHSVLNDQPRQFYDVKVYLGGPFYNACPAYVSSLKITNFL